MTAAPEQAGARPLIAYVAGAGRSGSTLLDMLLGSHSRMVSTGQVDELHDWVAREERCTCLEPFDRCPLWSHWVPAPGDASQIPPELNARTALKKVIGTVAAIATGRPPGDPAEAEATWALMDAVAAASASAVVVDSSKSVTRVARLNAASQGGRLRVLHLVRDPRGYVTSRSAGRPDTTTSGTAGHTPTVGKAMSIVVWLVQNSLVGAYGALRCRGRYLVVPYDEVISRPEESLGTIASFLGLEFEPGMLPPFTEGTAHLVSGNDTRLWGYKELRVDERWRRELPKRDQVVVQATCGWLYTLLKRRSGLPKAVPA